MPNDLRDHVLNFDSCHHKKRGFRYHGLSHGRTQDPYKRRTAKKIEASTSKYFYRNIGDKGTC